MSRGAMFAFASLVTACGGSVDSTGDAGAADVGAVSDTRVNDGAGSDATPLDGGQEEDTGNPAPPYGLPPPDDGGPQDEGGSQAEYGAPPPPDAG